MRFRFCLALGSAALGYACGSEAVNVAGNVAVSVATQAPQTLAPTGPDRSRAAVLDDTIKSGQDTVIITRARIVLRQIELKRAEVLNCDTQGPGNCEEVEFGPVLLDLPLEQGAERKFNIALPAGTYTEIEFDVHKPDDGDPQDQVFIQQNPEFARISIRVDGTFNGNPVVFESELDVEQELDLQPPLVVEAQTFTNITIFVDLDSWFRRADGTLVDPSTANKDGANENLVKDNIIASMRAFEDRDEDGDSRDG